MKLFGPRVGPPSDSLGRVIQSLCAAPIAAAFSDQTEEPPPVFPGELAGVSRAVPSRQREFASGRWAARQALTALGVAAVEIPMGPDRAPCWPAGVVGSITHCSGFVGAMVTSAERVRGLGFDAEPATQLGTDLLSFVCTASELAWINATVPPDAGDWAKVIFSAKEAVHKCISPLSVPMLGFREITIHVDPSEGSFSTAAVTDAVAEHLDFQTIKGRFVVSQGLVFTCAWIE